MDIPLKFIIHPVGVLFGVLFNAYIDRHPDHGHGMVALWVAIGVLATLLLALPVVGATIAQLGTALTGQMFAGVPVLAWCVLRDLLVCFATTGAPMVIGAYNRYLDTVLR